MTTARHISFNYCKAYNYIIKIIFNARYVFLTVT